jgi:8-oxo-dGTP diphosphatase
MTTTVFLVRHAKAADRTTWAGSDRDRPLVERGHQQAARLARALAGTLERPVLVAASPWRRCLETAEPIAEALGLVVEEDGRLGYDGPDLAGFVLEAAARAGGSPGRAVVAVSHGDLIPRYLEAAGLVAGVPSFRTGSLFRVQVDDGAPVAATLLDRGELSGWPVAR